MSDLAAALMVAIRVHAGQLDKQGEPYLLHVARVVESVGSERAKVLAALHDVAEDGDINRRDFEGIFAREGMWIANSVEVLTRSPGETYAEYIQGIADGHSSTWVAEIREVKLADLRDNLGRIPPQPEILGRAGTHQRTVCSVRHREWCSEWAPLKRRYEQAIKTLEGASGMLSSHPKGTEASDADLTK